MSALRKRRKLERRIGRVVDKLIAAMGLDWLEVQLLFDEKGDPESVAKSHCNWEYRRLVMTWTLPEAMPLRKDELRIVAIHELCHSLIEPLWDSHPDKNKKSVTKLGELCTENIARVVQALLLAPA